MYRSQNMSDKKKMALRILQHNKIIDVVIHDTDKNVGPACPDEEDVIKENKDNSRKNGLINNCSRISKSAYWSNKKETFL